ncbi:UNVERIFIED_CONTAM: hypothetical protein K2H54_066891, partial [Gekko kuhli]
MCRVRPPKSCHWTNNYGCAVEHAQMSPGPASPISPSPASGRLQCGCLEVQKELSVPQAAFLTAGPPRAEPELTVAGACLENMASRATAASMDSRACRGKRDIGVTPAHKASLAPTAKTARGETMEKWDPVGFPENRGHKGSQAPPVSRGPQGLRVWQDRKALWGLQGKRAPMGNLASPGCLARTDPLATLGKRVTLEPKETRVHPVLKVRLATPALVVRRGKMASRDPEARTARRVPKAGRAPTEIQAPLGFSERRESWEFLACLATRGDRDPRAHKVSPDSLGQTARKVDGGPEVSVDHEEPRGSLEQRAPPAVKDRRDLSGSGACQDRKGQTGSPDQKDPRAPPGRTGFPATLDNVEKLASKARLAQLDHQGWWDPRGLQGRGEHPGLEAPLDPQEGPGLKDLPALRGRRVCLARRVPSAPPAVTESRVPSGCLVRREPRGAQVRMAT